MLWRRSAAVFLTLLVTAGCGRPGPSLGPAPAFQLQDLAGGSFTSESLRGKVVVLDFWATWCGPCITEIPDYDDFWRRNRGRGVEVIGIVVESGEAREIEAFVREARIAYRQLLGDDRIQEAFQVDQGLPTTFVIDRDGRVAARILGAVPGKFESLQKTVDALLAGRSS